MSRKSLDHILNDVDEPEVTLDAPKESEPVKAETDEHEDTPDTEVAEVKAEKPEPKAKAEEGDDKKDGLPPWMHARVKSATEAKTAAEKRAEEAERRIAEYEAMMRGGQQQQPTLENYLQQMQAQQASEIQKLKVSQSRRAAVSEFGAEEVERAIAWAYDRCSADPQFNQMMWQSGDPAFDAVREFRKAQTFLELEKYGGDLNKLIEAKLAERGQVQTDEVASPQVQSQRKMPGNFSGQPSAQTGRSGPAWTGPKPLSDLLK